DVPPRREVKDKFAIKDEEYCLSRGKLYFEDVLIDPKNRGIQNAVVWLRPDAQDRKAPFPKENIHPKRAAAEAKTYTVTVTCCQFEPRVIAARAGDSVSFKNASNIPHNANYLTVGADSEGRMFNVLVPASKSYSSPKPLSVTRGPDTYRCSIHPWMTGYVWAFDHPYSAVTAADGSFAIPDAPVGKWRLVVWHERTGYRNWQSPRLGDLVTIADDGKGECDLGAIEFDSDAWDEKDPE